MTNEHRVYLTQIEDGSWLAASVSAPWFCLSGLTEEEALNRVQNALNFWCEHRHAPIVQKVERTVAPFAPQRVESIRTAVACA